MIDDSSRRDAAETRRGVAAPPDFCVEESATRPIEIGAVKARTRGVLVQMSGNEAGRVYRLDADTTTIGRGKGCTLRFDDTSLSRVHARVLLSNGRYVLEDGDSLNGSYLNGVRVQRVNLADGDRVRMATAVSMRFEIMDEDEEAALIRTYESSIRDGLTGIFNRRQLEERLVGEVSYAARHGTPLGVVVLDLDHFKRINDTHGHLAGDAVLKAVAAVLTSTVRREDVVGRYGGEEFVIVTRGIPLEGATRLAERVRCAVEAIHVPFGTDTLRVTASAGVASLACCAPPASVADLLGRADARLYRAKDLGRNRVVAA